jgi:uncharacterized membrane protein
MRQRLVWLGIVFIVLALVAGCAQETAAPEEVAQVTEVVVATDTAVPPTNTAEPTATDEPTETPEPTATAEPTFTPTPEVVVSNCLVCHADQEMLINTAAPEEEAPGESESSGVG